jgi:hypothetical protein
VLLRQAQSFERQTVSLTFSRHRFGQKICKLSQIGKCGLDNLALLNEPVFKMKPNGYFEVL